MGWNTSALFIQDASIADAIAALTPAVLDLAAQTPAVPDLATQTPAAQPPAGQTPAALAPDGGLVGADEATSGLADGVLFAAETGGWVQVWDPSMELVPACEPPGNALIVVFSSVTS